MVPLTGIDLQDLLEVSEEKDGEGDWRLYDRHKKVVRREWTSMVNSQLGSLTLHNLRQCRIVIDD